jgi:hypothetical protein
MSTAPIFAPDGTVRQIPQESVQDALSAGGKRATLMTDPTGTLRYIPEDQVPQAMQAGGKLYQDPNAPPNTLGDMADVALQGLKGIAQISAPGIAASLINKTAPGLAAKLQQVPYIGPLMQQAAPLKNIPGMATAAMASPLAEGMEMGDLTPDPTAPRPQPAPASPNAASPNGSSLLKIMSRHIPVIGRGLRAMDTVQDLQNLVNGPASSPQPAATPTPTQIPETNGIPWGSGGQGPLGLRGQRFQARKRNLRHKLRTCKRNRPLCNPRSPRPCFNSIQFQTHPSSPGTLTIRKRKPPRCSLKMGKCMPITVSLRTIGPITAPNRVQAKDSKLTSSAIPQLERAARRGH